MAEINIYGKLTAKTVDGVIAGAEQVCDSSKNMMQSEINAEFDSALLAQSNLLSEYTDAMGTTLEEGNPEYLRVYTDSEGRVLFGIHTDGSVDWAKGIPTPVKVELERMEGLIDALLNGNVSDAIESLREVLSYLDGIKDDTSLAATLVRINNELVRIEAEASGRMAEIEGRVEQVENWKEKVSTDEEECPEFINVVTDAEGKVLAAIRRDGSLYLPGNELYAVDSSPEWLHVITDAVGQVLWGIRRDGTVYNPQLESVSGVVASMVSEIDAFVAEQRGVLSEALSQALSQVDEKIREMPMIEEECPEFINVVTDAEGKVVEGTRADGTKEFVRQQMDELTDNVEYKSVTVDNVGRIVSGITVEDEEVHNLPQKFNERLVFSDKSRNSLLADLRKHGTFFDWSDEKSIHIPVPKFAKINIKSPVALNTIDHKGGMSGCEPGVNMEVECELEFWDFAGNYFKKPILLSAQGSSSMGYFPIRNNGFDFSDGTELKFGNWFSNDSYHIKKYWIDVMRGNCIIGYHLAEQVMRTRPFSQRRGYSYLNTSTAEAGMGNVMSDLNTVALCHPDGFPVEMYYNGVYEGLYVWSLKKHRSNYGMKKDETKKILIDGAPRTMWQRGEGTDIDWRSFELKNPKKLYYTDVASLAARDAADDSVVNGEYELHTKKYYTAHRAIELGLLEKYKVVDGKRYYEYDGDYADEIAGAIYKPVSELDETSTVVNGVEVITYNGQIYEVETVGGVKCIELSGLLDGGVTKRIKDFIETRKAHSSMNREEFAAAFNLPLMIDYWLFSEFTYNQDGLGNNCQWTSYDLLKMAPNYYDLDCIFGADWSGHYFEGSATTDLDPAYCFATLVRLFPDEIRARYHELRHSGVFTSGNVVDLYESWLDRIGYDALKRDIDEMKARGYTIPSWSSAWHNSLYRIERWVDAKIGTLDVKYNYNINS